MNRNIMRSAALRLFAAVILILSAQAAGFARTTDQAKIQEFVAAYQYDHSLPLNVTIEQQEDNSAYTVYRLEYDSLNGERIPALLHIPKGAEGKMPCVISMHGYGMDKSGAGMFAGMLVPRGYAMIAIDAQYHGDRVEEGKDIFSTDIDSDVIALKQTVIDLRRAVDYLETRDDIDAARIGYTGMSMGGFLGSIFMGVEPRVKTAVLVVAGGDWEKLIPLSQVSCFVKMREWMSNGGLPLGEISARMQIVDPVNFIGMASPRPILFLNSDRDTYVPKPTTEALFEAAGEPKKIAWYTPIDANGHIPQPGKVSKNMVKWFEHFLKK